MKKLCNVHTYDRLARLIIGTLLFQAGYFWLDGTGVTILLILSAVLVVTAVVGFCPLYQIFGWNTCKTKPTTHSPTAHFIAGLLLGAMIVGGSYASIFFTNKIFLEHFTVMNNDYKQTLFYTGNENREESITHYTNLIESLNTFVTKYATYRPYTLRSDEQLTSDLVTISTTVASVSEQISSGDLHQAHLALETVRPTLQDILKRNGFSLLAVALIDFHDAMELVVTPATEKDSAGVLAAYPEADTKLQAVEEQTNDTEIQAIRTNLDTLKQLAADGKTDELPDQGAKLKASFVKVYLARG